MKNPASALKYLVIVLTSALTLGSCSRAEYAFLPHSAPYLGPTAAAPRVRATAPTPTPATQVPAAATAPEITVATTPAAGAAEAAAPVAARPAPAVAAVPPRQPTLVQRLALARVTKKLSKLAAKTPQLKQGDNTAHTARIDGNLRTGIILLLVGLLIGILNGTIGTIIAIIGLIFIVLWLLDSL